MAGNDFSDGFSKMIEIIKGYVNTRVDFIKLGMVQKLTRAGVFLLHFYFCHHFNICSLYLFIVSFSFWYGDQTGNLAQGFLLSSIFFLLILFLIYLLRRVFFLEFL